MRLVDCVQPMKKGAGCQFREWVIVYISGLNYNFFAFSQNYPKFYYFIVNRVGDNYIIKISSKFGRKIICYFLLTLNLNEEQIEYRIFRDLKYISYC